MISSDVPYQTHHSSYIQDRSAPSTPGILGRSSSRRQLVGGGLSRRLSLYSGDVNTPIYAGVPVNKDGVALTALRGDAGLEGIPKARSDAALLTQRRGIPTSHTQLSAHSGGGGIAGARHHRRSHTGGAQAHRRPVAESDDWLTRAGYTTSSLLRESKGQSWLSSRHSSTSLTLHADPYASADSDSSDDEAALRQSRISISSAQRLHFADDELSPETLRYNLSRWGSRFGSRAPSARTSRRGSKVDLSRTPTITVSAHHPHSNLEGDYFARFAPGRDQHAEVAGLEPDFVDLNVEREDDDGEDPEMEIARLARERRYGLGGWVDRLVGWSLFNLDEDRETTDFEDAIESHGNGTGAKKAAADGESNEEDEASGTPRPRPVRQVLPARDLQSESANADAAPPEENGWQDAAWLLSVASKVIL